MEIAGGLSLYSTLTKMLTIVKTLDFLQVTYSQPQIAQLAFDEISMQQKHLTNVNIFVNVLITDERSIIQKNN